MKMSIQVDSINKDTVNQALVYIFGGSITLKQSFEDFSNQMIIEIDKDNENLVKNAYRCYSIPNTAKFNKYEIQFDNVYIDCVEFTFNDRNYLILLNTENDTYINRVFEIVNIH